MSENKNLDQGEKEQEPKREVRFLDTNVLMNNSDALVALSNNGECDLVLHGVVIKELDKYKKTNHNSRKVARFLKDIKRDKGTHTEGEFTFWEMDNGARIYIEYRVLLSIFGEGSYLSQATVNDADYNDTVILAAAKHWATEYADKFNAKLYTNDGYLELKSAAVSVESVDFREERIHTSPQDLLQVSRDIHVSEEIMDKLSGVLLSASEVPESEELYPNQPCVFISSVNPKRTHLAIFKSKEVGFEPVSHPQKQKGKIYPYDREQAYAMKLLLDDNVPLVALTGIAGCGKTLLALNAALQKQEMQSGLGCGRITIFRPMIGEGVDIGALPGDYKEKVDQWTQPIEDSFMVLADFYTSNKELMAHLLNSGYRGREEASRDSKYDFGAYDFLVTQFSKGRNMPDRYIIVDEAQDMTPSQIKMIITRAGEGCKVVLTGDTEQINHTQLDVTTSGLSVAIEAFQRDREFGHIHFTKSYRSKLAELAAKRL